MLRHAIAALALVIFALIVLPSSPTNAGSPTLQDLIARVITVESRTAALQSQLADLAGRLAALETGGGSGAPSYVADAEVPSATPATLLTISGSEGRTLAFSGRCGSGYRSMLMVSGADPGIWYEDHTQGPMYSETGDADILADNNTLVLFSRGQLHFEGKLVVFSVGGSPVGNQGRCSMSLQATVLQ